MGFDQSLILQLLGSVLTLVVGIITGVFLHRLSLRRQARQLDQERRQFQEDQVSRLRVEEENIAERRFAREIDRQSQIELIRVEADRRERDRLRELLIRPGDAARVQESFRRLREGPWAAALVIVLAVGAVMGVQFLLFQSARTRSAQRLERQATAIAVERDATVAAMAIERDAAMGAIAAERRTRAVERALYQAKLRELDEYLDYLDFRQGAASPPKATPAPPATLPPTPTHMPTPVPLGR